MLPACPFCAHPVQVAAIGTAPGMYLLPVALFLGARRGRLSRWQTWGLYAFFLFYVCASLVAGIGALWSIIVSASSWEFYS